MTLVDLIRSCPPQADLTSYLSAHLKGIYRNHLEYLKTASEKDNPLQPDAVQWLADVKQLADDIHKQGVTIDAVVDGYVGRLRALNVPKEAAVLRAQKREEARSISRNNQATTWRVAH